MNKANISRYFVLTLIGISATVGGAISPYSTHISAQESATIYSSNSKSITAGNHALQWPVRGGEGNFAYGFTSEHQGVDITGALGTPILAVADGEVVKATWDDYGLGNMVEILHPDGSLSVYGHNSQLLVRKGHRVKKGQIIAKMGSTGNSRAPHVHLEFYRNSEDWYPVNPQQFLPPLVNGRIPYAQRIAADTPSTSPIAAASRSNPLYRVEVPGNSQWRLDRVRNIEPNAFVRRGEGIIQVGVFRNQARAQQLLNSLQTINLDARVVTLN